MKAINIFRTLAAIAIATLGIASPSHAAVTAFLSAGTTCAGANSASYTTSGPAVKVSLCVSTTVEALCGNSYRFLSANAGENGRFNLTARAMDPAYNFSNVALVSFPIPINNTAAGDLGAGTASNTPVAAAANQLLATLDVSPQGTATNAAYVISLDAAFANVTVDGGDSTCGGGLATTSVPLAASFTLNLSSPPAFTSAAPPTPGTVGVAYNHTFTASGSPAPTFSITVGALPTGLLLNATTGAVTGTPTAGGTFNYTVTATNSNSTATQPGTIVINPGTQTVTFTPATPVTFGVGPSTLTASTTAGALPITFSTSSLASICTVSGSTLTITGGGTCNLTATQAGNANYSSAFANASVVINPTVPGAPTGIIGTASGPTTGTVSFTAPANTGGTPITSYAVTCTPAGGTDASVGLTLSHNITGLTTGTTYTCTVRATNAVGFTDSVASNGFVPSLAPIPASFTSPANNTTPAVVYTVDVAGPTFNITATGVPTPDITRTGGTLPTGMNFTAGAAGTGTATLTGTPTQAGTFTLTFTATSTTSPAGVNQTFTLTVAKGTQTINFTAPGAQTYSATPITLTATTVPVGRAVTFASTSPTICSVSGTSVTMLAVGTCSLTATQAGDANYNALTTAPQSFVISAAPQTITFGAQLPNPRGFTITSQPISPLATASSGLPVSYAGTPGVCTVSGNTFTPVALGLCTITASQAGDTRYSAAASVPQSFTIAQGTQTISMGSLPNWPLGTPPITVSPTATSGLAVTITSLTPTVCTAAGVNGTLITLLAVGTCNLQGVQAGNGTTFAAAAPVTGSFSITPPGAVTLTTSSNPAVYRSIIILTADISGTNPTGTVTFTLSTVAGPVTLCAAVPLVAARATCPVPAHLNVNAILTYSATYSGDANNPLNTATLQQLINTNAVTLTVSTNPIVPAVGAKVELRAMVAGVNLTNKVQFNENGTALPNCGAVTLAPLPSATNIAVASCTITAITAGPHNYVVTYPHATDAGFEQVVVPVTPVSGPADFTDMWWVGPSENGWGVSITQHGGIQFIVLYVYDASGNPIWYVMPGGNWNASNTAYTGALYKPTSSPYSAYNSSQFVPGASVGNATITYTGSGTATMTYTINGVSGSKAIVREGYAKDDGVAKMQVGDMWWAGYVENGWGMNISQQGRQLFPVWYTYDSNGRTVFYTVPGGTWNGSSFTGDIYSTVSSAWLGVNYNPAQFVVTKVGSMTLDFADQSNAVMTYTVNGLTQKKVIMREQF